LDLSCLISVSNVPGLRAHRAALRRVDLSQPFPMESLLAATTLDQSQARALQAMLTQQVDNRTSLHIMAKIRCFS
jgi:hypothetical protein